MHDRIAQLGKARQRLRLSIEAARRLWYVRTHPEALKPLLEFLRGTGMTEPNVAAVRSALMALREAEHDRQYLFRIDRYLATGMGAVDLVFASIVLVLGAVGRPLFLATTFLVVSLVFVAMALFVNFVKRDLGITGYGKVHGTVIFVGQASGVAAVTATFWHSSAFAGVFFLVLAVVAYLACGIYWFGARWAVGYSRLQAALDTPTGADASPSTDESGQPQHSEVPAEANGRG